VAEFRRRGHRTPHHRTVTRRAVGLTSNNELWRAWCRGQITKDTLARGVLRIRSRPGQQLRYALRNYLARRPFHKNNVAGRKRFQCHSCKERSILVVADSANLVADLRIEDGLLQRLVCARPRPPHGAHGWNRTQLGPAVGSPSAHGGTPQKSMSAFWRKADISNVLTNVR
jgi:hypothetical protein